MKFSLKNSQKIALPDIAVLHCTFDDANVQSFEAMSQLMVKFFRKNLLIVVALLGVAGCGPDKEVIVNEKVSERVTAFRLKRNAECRAALLRDAEKIVDSLLLEEAKSEMRDSLIRLKPFKPSQPAFLPPIDTLEVLPLFLEPASSTRGGE